MARRASWWVACGLAACSAPPDDVAARVPPAVATCDAAVEDAFCDGSALAGIDRVSVARADQLPTGGVALADFDGDGDLDLFATGHDYPSAYYVNDGAGRYVDATDAAGLGDVGQAAGAGVADLDGDGDVDLVVTGKTTRIRVFDNDGAGRFVERGVAAGFGDQAIEAESVAVADYDGDGDVDVFVTTWQSVGGSGASPELLYRNDGAWTFAEVGGAAGIPNDRDALGLAAAFVDVDGDRDLDLYVANDFGMLHVPNFDLRNRGDGTFESVDRGGRVAVLGMSASPADFDNDGDFDIYVTNVGDNVLLVNDGAGNFADGAAAAGATAYGYADDAEPYGRHRPFSADAADPFLRTFAPWAEAYLHPELDLHVTTSWAAVWLDYDSDGWLDLYVCNGYLGGGLAPEGRRQPNALLRNRGDGTFADATAATGTGDRGDAQGCAAGDVDGDGDVDLVIANTGWNDDPTGGRLTILRNDAPQGHFLRVRLVGPAGNTEGIGARIEARAGSLRMTRAVSGGDGFLSASERTAHFGLGDAATVDELVVTWPDGRVDRLADVAADRTIVVEH